MTVEFARRSDLVVCLIRSLRRKRSNALIVTYRVWGGRASGFAARILAPIPKKVR